MCYAFYIHNFVECFFHRLQHSHRPAQFQRSRAPTSEDKLTEILITWNNDFSFYAKAKNWLGPFLVCSFWKMEDLAKSPQFVCHRRECQSAALGLQSTLHVMGSLQQERPSCIIPSEKPSPKGQHTHTKTNQKKNNKIGCFEDCTSAEKWFETKCTLWWELHTVSLLHSNFR